MSALSTLPSRQQKLAAAIVKNLGKAGDIKIDWDAVAKDAGMSSATYARSEYSSMRRTLDSVGESNSAPSKKKASSKKRKSSEESDEGDEEILQKKKTQKGGKNGTEGESGSVKNSIERDDREAPGFIRPGFDSDDGELV